MESPRNRVNADLAKQLELRRKLAEEYRCARSSTAFVSCGFDVDVEPSHSRRSFFEVIGLFGPVIHSTVANRHAQRDAQLITEANRVIVANIGGRGPGVDNTRILLSIQLELQTLLCTEYRCVRPLAALQSRN